MQRLTKKSLTTCVVLAVAVCFSGCDASGGDNSPGSPVDGLGQADAGAADTLPAVDSSGETCGGGVLALEVVHPNVLLLFDRSCSMRRKFDDPSSFSSGPADPDGRWYVAREAVKSLTSAFQHRLRFGLMLFPAPKKGCGDLPQLDVSLAVGAQQQILAKLDEAPVVPYTYCTQPGSTTPGEQPHVTPTAEALSAARAVPALADSSRDNIVILITDGYATCGATAASLRQQTAGLKAAGVSTAVVGFGDVDTSVGTSMMNAIAEAGGLALVGQPQKYHLATDRKGLVAALESIAASAVSCRFKLKQTPPNGEKLYTYVNGKESAKDDPNGWRYDPQGNAVELLGDTCLDAKQGKVTQLKVVFGCPDPVCVPSPEVCDGLDNDCNGKVDDGCLK